MAVTVVATAKATNANSYVSVADADTYFEGRLNASGWESSATADEKNRAVVMATNRLEQEEYHGTPTSSTQRLLWPRSGLSDDDGRSYDQDTIPRPVEEATYELALALLNGETELKDTGLEGFNRAKVGRAHERDGEGLPKRDPEEARDPEGQDPRHRAQREGVGGQGDVSVLLDGLGRRRRHEEARQPRRRRQRAAQVQLAELSARVPAEVGLSTDGRTIRKRPWAGDPARRSMTWQTRSSGASCGRGSASR
jgi:hypothetical protein